MTTTPSPDQRARFEAKQITSYLADWKIVAHALREAQKDMESGCPRGRYTWMDAPAAIAEQYASTPPREVAQGLREAVEEMTDAGLWGVDYVGSANYRERQEEARAHIHETRDKLLAALAPYVTAPSSPAPTSGKEGTPLTDAAEPDYHQEGENPSKFGYVPADFARQLERDLTAAREEVERYSSDWQKVVKVALECDPIPACKRDDDQLEPPWEVFARLRSQLATLRATSEELAGALEGVLEYAKSDMDEENNSLAFKAEVASWRAALVNFRAATPAQPVPADEADGEEKRDHMSSLALGEGCAAVQSALAARAQGGSK